MRCRLIGMGVVVWILFSGAMLFAQQNPNSLMVSAGNPSVIRAPGNAVEMTDIHDIKPPEKVWIDAIFFYCLLLAAFFLLLLFAGFYFWKRRAKAAELDVAPVPPDVKALRLLNELADAENSDEKIFYFRLSAILRHYIRDRYGVNAPEMTTEEFLPRVGDLGCHIGLQKPLRELLRSTDPIKFARVPAGEEKMKNDLVFVKKFVKQTTLMQDSEENRLLIGEQPIAINKS